ncbi:MAG: adenylate kinase [Candidatus Competibacteraceae bacterium]|nr:adenylate kinase [Candidatus Competibacteraceae bacterium]
MLNIVLFGPPGAGKGTQSERIVNKYKLVHLSTGDIFRYNIKQETDLGKLAKSYIDKGELVPDQVTIDMLNAEVEKQVNPNGFIFDGFPRTTTQADALDKHMISKGSSITMMLSLHVPEEELIKRLLLRGKESGRSDDTDENIIRNRIRVYNEQTAVAANYYEMQNKYHQIDGIGTIEDIFERLCQIIDKHSTIL